MKRVRSGIPLSAIEKAVRKQSEQSKLHGDRMVDCFLEGERVGRRVYNRAGLMVQETPMRAGRKHGRELTWDDDGNLLSVEPYVDGKAHGTATQYGRHGKAIGTYRLVHGTGLDIWRQEDEDGTVFVAEIHSLRDGSPDGYERWFVSARQDLWHERHWKMGRLHGIERMWNRQGRLRRGYPRFYVEGEAVPKQKYLRMASLDKTLPAFREKDNAPERK